MNKIFLLFLLFDIAVATEYRVAHLPKGRLLNVREEPVVNSRTLIGRLPANAMGIEIRECKYGANAKEWCYITYGVGRKHIEGWVSRYYLEPMSDQSIFSLFYIKHFLRSYYKADEENFLDKINRFYTFPMQQYMTQKGVSRMSLRAAKVRFYKRWPRRYYTLGYMKILKRAEDYIDVQATVHWKYINHEESESGRDIHKLRLVYEGNQFRVLAIKQLLHKVYPKLEESEPLLAQTDTNKTVESEGYYIKAGSFFSMPSEDYLNKILSIGYRYVIDNAIQGESTIKRVYIGPFPTTEETMKALERVHQEVNKDAYIQRRVP
jgi:hypothetical protein